MKIKLLVLLVPCLILISISEIISQDFTANPTGESMIVNIRGKQYTGGLGQNYTGNVEMQLRRSDQNDNALIKFFANPLNLSVLTDHNEWVFGLKSEDKLGIYYTDGSYNNPSTSAAVTFNNSSGSPYASFGSTSFLARVTIRNDLYGQKGLHAVSSGHGVYGESFGTGPAAGYGVYGMSTGSAGVYGTSTSKEGVYGYSSANDGVLGRTTEAGFAGVRGEGDTYGVYGSGDYWGVYGSGDAWAVYGVSGPGTGVRGTSNESYGVVGKTENEASYAGYFIGDVFTSGSYLPSDQNLKHEAREIENALALIEKLHPQTYQYRRSQNQEMNLPTGQRFGLIAQELEQILPQLVKETFCVPDESDDKQRQPSGTFKAVNYVELIPILIAAIQEQSDTINNLIQNNAQLSDRLDVISQAMASGLHEDISMLFPLNRVQVK